MSTHDRGGEGGTKWREKGRKSERVGSWQAVSSRESDVPTHDRGEGGGTK